MKSIDSKYTGIIAFPTIILFTLLAIGYVLLVWLYIHQTISLAWIIGVGAFLAYGMFTIAHEASHGNISGGNEKYLKLELLLGWLSSLMLFFPYPAFKVIHLEHHAHTNDPEKDPDGYVNGKSFMSTLFRCITLVFHYYYRALKKDGDDIPAMKKTKRGSQLFIALIVSLFLLFIVIGKIQLFLYVFLIPALIAAPFLAFSFDWLPHYPHHNLHQQYNTRIVTIPGLEFLSFFQSYHLVHHLYPRVPFYKYKAKFLAVENELLQLNSPVEGFRNNDLKLFQKENTYVDLLEGDTWNYALEVEEIKELTHDSALIKFKRVGGIPFKFIAGQYVVVSLNIDNQKVSRCYSICANPDYGDLAIAVKRVSGGKLSNKLLDNIKVGTKVNVSGPFGEFQLLNEPQHTFIAGGSGITPIISMISQALENGKSNISLLYGCKSKDDVMFNEDLITLTNQYPEQFKLYLTFDNLTIDKQREYLSDNDAGAFYLCGPEPMMKASRILLAEKDVASTQIASEEFVQLTEKPSGVEFEIQTTNFDYKGFQNETILSAALRQNQPLPYACASGQCGTCKAKLIEGKVEWKITSPPAILENEKDAGYILTCMCQPKTNVSIKF